MTTLKPGSRPSILGERRSLGAPTTPAEQEQLPCPRCESSNTKFCYYNNYNFSQPRYFCKSCRRYWTRGGALRDVPVGGGARRPAKRSRTSSPSPSPSPCPSARIAVSGSPDPDPVYSGSGFTSLLALGGFGVGVGVGLDDVRCGYGYGYGLGNAGWVLPEPGYGNGGGGSGVTWHLESGDGVGSGNNGEYYLSVPELAISTTPSTTSKCL